ncbi:MAG: cyclic nucleotide-binding domain-containing protein, partial [Chloroflexi bacterium]|nr:cyclic nucleotide-binding domain-containing protein [Chloroflexota bacterium]
MKAPLDLIEHLRRAPVFSRMSEWHLDLVAGICDVHVVPAGTRLCRQADLGALFFLIESGEAVLHRVDERGLQRPVGLVRAGDSFGTTSLFLGEPRDATA